MRRSEEFTDSFVCKSSSQEANVIRQIFTADRWWGGAKSHWCTHTHTHTHVYFVVLFLAIVKHNKQQQQQNEEEEILFSYLNIQKSFSFFFQMICYYYYSLPGWNEKMAGKPQVVARATTAVVLSLLFFLLRSFVRSKVLSFLISPLGAIIKDDDLICCCCCFRVGHFIM